MVNFNDLPDDCIFNVLFLLEGGQLEVMKSVNQRIRRLANQPMFNDVKRIIREVRIQKNEDGFTLFLKSDDGLSILHHFPHQNHGISFDESENIRDCRVVWRRDDPPAYQRFIQRRSTPSGFVKVPDNRLATTLENYLVDSETRSLKIVDMVFSEQFLEESVKMCRNTDDFHLIFDGSQIEKNYPDLYTRLWPTPPPVMNLLYSVSSLVFINTDFCEYITQTFFIFGYGEKSKGKSLVVKNDDHYKYDNFYPSSNIIDILVLFKYFNVPYLTLDSSLITDFLLKATENTESEAKWIFSLNSFLSYDDKLDIRNNFEVQNLRGGESDGMDFKLISHKHNKIIEGETKPYRGKYFSQYRKFQLIEVSIYPKD